MSVRKRKGKAKDWSEIANLVKSGNDLVAQKYRHVKVQGKSGTGKTHFLLKHLEMWKLEGLSPAEYLLVIIDCGLEGQAELIRRKSVVPEEYRDCIKILTAVTPPDVYQAYDYFIHLLREHAKEYPDSMGRMLIFENEGAYYNRVRNYYAEEVYGIPERELLLQRQQEARQETTGSGARKKTKPQFEEGPMHAYKVINKVFGDIFHDLKMAAEIIGFHFYSTTLEREVSTMFDNKKGAEAIGDTKIITSGRPDMTDPLFDMVIRTDFEEKTKRVKGAGTKVMRKWWLKVIKTRMCKPFHIDNCTVPEFWQAVEEMND